MLWNASKAIVLALCLIAGSEAGAWRNGAAAPTADWTRTITASPYNATCNGVADDTSAFASFNTDAQAQSALGNSVMMVIPSGKACVLSSGSPARLGDGVKDYTIYGPGASISDGSTGSIVFGGQAQFGGGNGNGGSARLTANVNPGDSCVSIPTVSPVTISNIALNGGTWRLTVSDSTGFTSGQIIRISGEIASNVGSLNGLQFINVISSGTPGTIDVVASGQNVDPSFSYTSGGKINDFTGVFVAGQYALIGGLDVQASYQAGGFGSPSNPSFYEYAKIASVNTGTGQVCFTAPLMGTYKTTWPNYDVGGKNGPDPGGGATIWQLASSWDTSVRLYNVTIASPTGQHTMTGRSMYVYGVANTGANGVIPSAAGSFTGINDSWSSGFEIDKINGPVSCTSCSWNIFGTQSRSSSTALTLTGSTIAQLNGTPANTTLNNVIITTQLQLGPSGYGGALSFTGSNVSTPILTYNSIAATGSNGLNNEPGWSMSGDTITAPMSIGALPWAVDGNYICWFGNLECEDIAKIVAVGQSGTNVTVKLNKSYAGNTWPAVTGGKVKLRAHPMPAYTCNTNCTGNTDIAGMTGAPAGAPLYSYWSSVYSGTIGGTPQNPHTLWGSLSSLSVNVTNAGGSSNFHLSEFDNWPVLSPAFTSVSWNNAASGPAVNTNVSGNRTIALVSGSYSVSGTQTGDVGWTVPNSSFFWFPGISNSGPLYSSAPSGCPGAGCTSATVTITTDQGIP